MLRFQLLSLSLSCVLVLLASIPVLGARFDYFVVRATGRLLREVDDLPVVLLLLLLLLLLLIGNLKSCTFRCCRRGAQ